MAERHRNKAKRAASLAERKRAAKAYVAQVRATTVCSRCGAQPVDFHSAAHETNPSRRIGNMANTRTVAAIAAEIARCEALCRKCHMTVDGRMERFVAAGRPSRQTTQPPKPCTACGRLAKPLRRGLCGACYARRHRQPYWVYLCPDCEASNTLPAPPFPAMSTCRECGRTWDVQKLVKAEYVALQQMKIPT